MTTIKRGTTPTILVQFDGIAPEDVQQIEFIFKHRPMEMAQEICTKSFPGDGVTYDAESGCFCIELTDDETRAFMAGQTAYMDTRITCPDGTIPATDIVKFGVMETLFQRSGV